MKNERLEKLNTLRERGLISEDDYQKEKAKILNESQPKGNLLGMDENTYCMVLHLSQLLGFILLAVGFIAPIVLWLLNKDENPAIDAHGKIVLNWLISALIYYGIASVLLFILIGYPLLIILFIAHIIFVTVGALKAKEGTLWKYPFSIQFFTVS